MFIMLGLLAQPVAGLSINYVLYSADFQVPESAVEAQQDGSAVLELQFYFPWDFDSGLWKNRVSVGGWDGIDVERRWIIGSNDVLLAVRAWGYVDGSHGDLLTCNGDVRSADYTTDPDIGVECYVSYRHPLSQAGDAIYHIMIVVTPYDARYYQVEYYFEGQLIAKFLRSQYTYNNTEAWLLNTFDDITMRNALATIGPPIPLSGEARLEWSTAIPVPAKTGYEYRVTGGEVVEVREGPGGYQLMYIQPSLTETASPWRESCYPYTVTHEGYVGDTWTTLTWTRMECETIYTTIYTGEIILEAYEPGSNSLEAVLRLNLLPQDGAEGGGNRTLALVGLGLIVAAVVMLLLRGGRR
ncbi:hypothetical protein [Aeropyrum globular virus 1]|uniref:hypothetical protein n=1 Tax=Aeropyrum globular virus 1 TaxID=1932713 RepID=UPI000C7F0A71|nr:hypothetical protein C1186_gp08 [Aeropyrum globular virus 1]BBC20934.1 hypothetical protein [Aeropyrum globular virus 1]